MMVREGPPGTASRHLFPTFSYRGLKLALLTYPALAILMTLAIWHPFPLLRQADPFAPGGAPRPDWYLMAPLVLLRILPSGLVGILGVLGLVVLLFWPLVEEAPRSGRGRQALRALGFALFVLWVGVTLGGVILWR